MKKVCTKCGVSKGARAFAPHSNTRDKKRPECRTCHAKYHRQARIDTDRDHYRRYELKRKYGITVDEYNQMFADHDGRCAICARHVSEIVFGKWKTLAVDHNHDTGAVRGLLCSKCNVGLGAFADDISRIEAAASYLRRYSKGEK